MQKLTDQIPYLKYVQTALIVRSGSRIWVQTLGLNISKGYTPACMGIHAHIFQINNYITICIILPWHQSNSQILRGSHLRAQCSKSLHSCQAENFADILSGPLDDTFDKKDSGERLYRVQALTDFFPFKPILPWVGNTGDTQK